MIAKCQLTWQGRVFSVVALIEDVSADLSVGSVADGLGLETFIRHFEFSRDSASAVRENQKSADRQPLVAVRHEGWMRKPGKLPEKEMRYRGKLRSLDSLLSSSEVLIACSFKDPGMVPFWP
jgi:hypothetical protein